MNPPLIIKIRGLARAPNAVVNEVRWARLGLDEGRKDFRAQEGRDIDVRLEVLS